ncbi:MAG: magnesium transporter MgtE N-terminal domain-containing protein, partial [Rhabdaerophilum calidifontis]
MSQAAPEPTLAEAPSFADLAFRDAEGEIRPAFLAAVRAAIEAADHDRLVALAGDLYEADLGQLIEALDPEERPRLVAILGADFDFAALTEVEDTVREEILEEIPNEKIAEGVRDLDSDDA